MSSISSTNFPIQEHLTVPDFEGYTLAFNRPIYTLRAELSFGPASVTKETAAAAASASTADTLKKVIMDKYHRNHLYSQLTNAVFVDATGVVHLFARSAESHGDTLRKVWSPPIEWTHETSRTVQLVEPEETSVVMYEDAPGQQLWIATSDGHGRLALLSCASANVATKGAETQLLCEHDLSAVITQYCMSHGMIVSHQQISQLAGRYPTRLLNMTEAEAGTLLLACCSCVDLSLFITPESQQPQQQDLVTPGASSLQSVRDSKKRQHQVVFVVSVHILRNTALGFVYETSSHMIGQQPVVDSWFEGSRFVVFSQEPFHAMTGAQESQANATATAQSADEDDVEMRDTMPSGASSNFAETPSSDAGASAAKEAAPKPSFSSDYIKYVNERLASYTAALDEEEMQDAIEEDVEDDLSRQFYVTEMSGLMSAVPPTVSTVIGTQVKQLLATSKNDKSFAIRQGFDMAAFVREDGLRHIASYPALAYVLEGKLQKKFVTFNNSLRYAYIAEHADHVFVYDCAHIDAHKKARHQVVEVQPKSTQQPNEARPESASGPIVGFALLTNHDMLILTQRKLFHYTCVV